jgi:hypothetical protein
MAETLLVLFASLLLFLQSGRLDGAPVAADSKSSAFYYLLNYGYIHKNENQVSKL